MKKRLLWILAAVFLCATVVSVLLCVKLEVRNPAAAAAGLVRVLFTDAECVEIQRAPKVILAKPGASLEAYMAQQGYENQEQMGSLRAFSNGNAQELVACSQNRYFAHWVWQK